MNESFVMVEDETETDVRALLAGNLRRLRVARHLSLSELARITATSKATLSGIEAGGGNPTTETLAAIAAALQAPIAELLEAAPQPQMRIVRKAATSSSHTDRVARRLLEATALDGTVEILELSLPAHTLQEEPPRASGARTHLLVLQGKLIAGPVERISELASGDYASFAADVPHSYESVRSPARALLLTYTPA